MTEVYHGFPQPTKQVLGSFLKIGHDSSTVISSKFSIRKYF